MNKQTILNKMNPTAEKVRLGDVVSHAPAVFSMVVPTGSHSAAIPVFTAPFAMRIVDIIVEALVTSSNGTLTPKKGATAMCTAIACATDKAVVHMSAGAVVAALELAAGDVVNVQANATGDTGRITFIGVSL